MSTWSLWGNVKWFVSRAKSKFTQQLQIPSEPTPFHPIKPPEEG
jgi:hypothetical protein